MQSHGTVEIHPSEHVSQVYMFSVLNNMYTVYIKNIYTSIFCPWFFCLFLRLWLCTCLPFLGEVILKQITCLGVYHTVTRQESVVQCCWKLIPLEH